MICGSSVCLYNSRKISDFSHEKVLNKNDGNKVFRGRWHNAPSATHHIRGIEWMNELNVSQYSTHILESHTASHSLIHSEETHLLNLYYVQWRCRIHEPSIPNLLCAINFQRYFWQSSNIINFNWHDARMCVRSGDGIYELNICELRGTHRQCLNYALNI